MEAPPGEKKIQEATKASEKESLPADSEAVVDADTVISTAPEVDETTLLNQEFLLDPDLTVREFVIQNNIEVVDFVRFECGENLE